MGRTQKRARQVSRAANLTWVASLPLILIVLAAGVYFPPLGLALLGSGLAAIILAPRLVLKPLVLPQFYRPAVSSWLIGFGLPFQIFSLVLNFSWLDALIVLLFAHFLLQSLRGKPKLGRALRQPIFWLYFLFILVNLLGLAVSLDVGKGLAAIAQFGLLLIWFAVLVTFLAAKGRLRLFLLGGAFGAGFCGLVGIVQHFFPKLLILPGVSAARLLSFQGRASSLPGDPNYFAAYLVTFIPLTLALLLTETRLRWLLILNLALMLPGFYFSYSRGGLLAMGVMLVVVALSLPRSLPGKGLALASLLTLALLGFVLLTGLDSRLSEQFTGRFATLLDERQVNRVARLGYANTAVNMFMDSPWVGRGPGQFPANFLRYRTDESIADWLTPVTHNSYAEVLATGGLLGAICLLMIILLTLYNLWKAGNQTKEREAVWARGLLAGIIGLLVAAFLLDLFTQRFFFALLAVATVLPHMSKEPDADS